MDSATITPLPNVSVCVKKILHCALSDNDGKFRISVDKNVRRLTFTTTGYHPLSISLTDSSEQEVTVLLSKSYTTLKDVVVNAKKKKYRNKNNPAVDLIRQVIANKSKNGPGAYPYNSFEQYEKIRVLFDKIPHIIADNRMLKKFHFMFENRDTALVTGKSLIPVYLEESISENYYRQHPEKRKKTILGRKSVDFGEYLDMKGISIALNRLYEDFNIYDNTISVFTMQFISPVADLAPTFYMYYIEDTVIDNGEKLVKLFFTPRNPEDLLFRGTLYITLDGNYAIRKMETGISKHTNLNWVKEFKVRQDFEKGPGQHYYLANSDMLAYFNPFRKTPGLYGERVVTVSHVTDTLLPDAVFNGPRVDSLSAASHQPTSFWADGRPEPLNASEARTYSNTDSLVKMRSYHRLADYITLFTAGYKSAGKFDIGPVANFYSFNSLEGQKLRFGGRSNAKLSKLFFMESYAAYGFKDERWKYFLSGTYSINHQSIYTYPFNYIQVSFQHDTKNPGQESVFAQGNAFLSSFTRGINTEWLYNDIFRVSYIHEFWDHLSYNLGMKRWKQQPAGSLMYLYEPVPGKFDTAQTITSSELSATLRWAPHEQFYQGRSIRSDIINKYPIITFQYAKGIKGFFGGGYDYDAYHLNIYKRFYLAPIGFSDVTFDGGWLGGNLPFPLLIIHPANQSYFYSENAYNLMNFGEFVSDHYAGINIDHSFNGFFFNKIPLFKKLRLREVVAAKLLYGGLRDENNPASNPSQMKFPLTNGLLSTYSLGGKPYFEASVGIYNIFSVIRIDLVKRFTYLDHPGISGLGLRFSSNFNF